MARSLAWEADARESTAPARVANSSPLATQAKPQANTIPSEWFRAPTVAPATSPPQRDLQIELRLQSQPLENTPEPRPSRRCASRFLSRAQLKRRSTSDRFGPTRDGERPAIAQYRRLAVKPFAEHPQTMWRRAGRIRAKAPEVE